jgi:hypothetical protein
MTYDRPEIRRRHGVKLIHLVEQVDRPLRALIDHLATMRMPENDSHFNGESLMVRNSIESLHREMELLNALAQAMLDTQLPDVRAWEPGDKTPDVDGRDEDEDFCEELPF